MIIVTKDNFIFVNAGDSRSVLYDEKGMRFETKDNNASDEIEKKRIIVITLAIPVFHTGYIPHSNLRLYHPNQ